jgi:hypothetical protein
MAHKRQPPDSQKAARDINREKGEQQKGNNHEKNPEHEHFIPGHNRPQTAPYGLLP